MALKTCSKHITCQGLKDMIIIDELKPTKIAIVLFRTNIIYAYSVWIYNKIKIYLISRQKTYKQNK